MWFLPSEAGPGSVVWCPVRRYWQLALPSLPSLETSTMSLSCPFLGFEETLEMNQGATQEELFDMFLSLWEQRSDQVEVNS